MAAMKTNVMKHMRTSNINMVKGHSYENFQHKTHHTKFYDAKISIFTVHDCVYIHAHTVLTDILGYPTCRG